ncbi:NAD-dependent epimerase/dehydratase family protein [Paraflavitalea sp. CAU 1676]|uniref:NAD-dependent epimerase/dehydratase family protein n=1 Tax=Paraflavitalea sp. CAU 1676 TaxID=3032598 RepID=UPI0023DA4105|nr:NAD-dependent epimerase/dehydratase family protein [Paraflavitalea sp. CAU 1676]MDF2190747.1 NAD-dependent epimerase/dehydratase family protein [Paraflavitalea sp. CAU 1676]
MIKKVFVTGGTGFLGAYIIQELVERGFAVRGLRRSARFPFFIPVNIMEQVEWVEGDILDVVSLDEAMEGIDAVIHAAAKVSFDPKEKEELFHINIDGTANVVNMALDKGVTRFVHISSVAALGRTANGDHVNETKKWQASKLNTQYAISKYHAEREVWRGMGEGLDVVVLNPSTILGYGDWSTSSCAIFKNSFREFPWYTNGVNGFVDVKDVARAAVLLMESNISTERFIVNGDNWSFQQLLNTIADGFGKKKPTREASPFMGEIAWRMERFKSLFSGKKPLLTQQSARVAQSKTFFDHQKLLKALPGFSFTPLTQSIQHACQQYLQHPQSL